MPISEGSGDEDKKPIRPFVGATAFGDGTDLTVSVSVEEEGHLHYRGDAPLQPDDPNNVARQTESIVSQFLWERYSHDLDERQLPENTPALPELSSQIPNPFSLEAQIGRQLANIGDDIDRRYQPQISSMIDMLKVNDSNAYETFSSVASSLFRDNQINWGRVIALFLFGYRIAIEKVKSGIRDFITKIVKWIATFVKEKICNWIANQGGWSAVVRLVPDSVSNENIGFVFIAAGCFALAAYFFSRRNY